MAYKRLYQVNGQEKVLETPTTNPAGRYKSIYQSDTELANKPPSETTEVVGDETVGRYKRITTQPKTTATKVTYEAKDTDGLKLDTHRLKMFINDIKGFGSRLLDGTAFDLKDEAAPPSYKSDVKTAVGYVEPKGILGQLGESLKVGVNSLEGGIGSGFNFLADILSEADYNTFKGVLPSTPDEDNKLKQWTNRFIVPVIDWTGAKLKQDSETRLAQHPEWAAPDYFEDDSTLDGVIANLKNHPGEYIARAVGENAPTLGFQILTALSTGGWSAMGAMGLMAGGETYEDAVAHGVPKDDAITLGVTRGTIEGALEKFGLDKLLGTGGSKAVSSTFSGLLYNGVKDMAIRVGTETSTEMAQEMMANAIAGTFDEQRGVFDNVAKAGFSALVTSAPVAGVTSSMDAASGYNPNIIPSISGGSTPPEQPRSTVRFNQLPRTSLSSQYQGGAEFVYDLSDTRRTQAEKYITPDGRVTSTKPDTEAVRVLDLRTRSESDSKAYKGIDLSKTAETVYGAIKGTKHEVDLVIDARGKMAGDMETLSELGTVAKERQLKAKKTLPENIADFFDKFENVKSLISSLASLKAELSKVEVPVPATWQSQNILFEGSVEPLVLQEALAKLDSGTQALEPFKVRIVNGAVVLQDPSRIPELAAAQTLKLQVQVDMNPVEFLNEIVRGFGYKDVNEYFALKEDVKAVKRGEKLSERKRFQTKGKKTRKPISKVEAERVVRKYFKEDEVQTRHIKKLVTPRGQRALGQYLDGVITFVENPDETTPTHESLHVFFDLFTSAQRKRAVLDDVKARYGVDDDLDAEEALADGFVNFARDYEDLRWTARVRAFLEDMWETFKALFGKEDAIRALYEDLARGERPEGQVRVPDTAFDEYRLAHFQEPEALTIKLLGLPEFQGKEMVGKTFLLDMAKSGKANLKQVEKELITKVVERDFATSDKIPLAKFKERIAAELVPLTVIESDTYADYGKGNFQEGLDDAETKTHIYNSPFEHGLTGHFESDFRVYENIQYRAVQIPGKEEWAAIRDGVVLTEENVQQNVATVGSKDVVLRWVDEHKTDKQPILRGLFGHTRVWDTKTERYVVEVQSDSFQRGRLEATTDPSMVMRNMSGIRTEALDELPPNERREHDELYELLAERKSTPEQTARVTELEEKAKTLFKENKSKLLAPLLAYKNTWFERMIREEVRNASLDGKETLRFPTPYSVAKIEGFFASENGGLPYEWDGPRDAGPKEGETITYGGEEYTVVYRYGSDPGFKAAASDKVRIFDRQQGIDEEVNSHWDDVWYELKKLEKSPETIEELDAISDTPPELESYFDALRETAGEDGKLDHDVAERHWMVREEELVDSNFDESLQGVWSEAYVYDGTVYVVEEGNSEDFQDPDQYEVVSNPEEFDIKNLSEEQQTVVQFYARQVIPYLKKLRKDLTEVVGEDGSTWLETKVTPEDAGPVAAFQVDDFDEEAVAKGVIDANMIKDSATVRQLVQRLVSPKKTKVTTEEGKLLRQQMKRMERLSKQVRRNLSEDIKAELSSEKPLSVKGRIMESIRPTGKKRSYTDSQLLKESLKAQQRVARVVRRNTAQELGAKFGEEKRNLLTEVAEKANFEKEQVESIREQIVNYAKLLPLEERGKLLVMVKNAKTKGDLAKAFTRIDNRIEAVEKQTLIAAIKKQYAKILKSPSIDVGYKARVSGLLDELLLTGRTEKTLKRLQSLQDYVNKQEAQGVDVMVPRKVLQSLRDLSRKSIKLLPAYELENILEQMALFAKLGKTKTEMQKLAFRREREHIIEAVLPELTPVETPDYLSAEIGTRLTLREHARNLAIKIKRARLYLGRAIRPMDVFFDMFSGSTGAYASNFFRLFKGRIDQRFGEYLDMKDEYQVPLVELAVQNALDDKNMERIGIYAMFKQEGGMDKLIQLGFTEAEVRKIELTDTEMNFYREMTKRFDELYPRVKEHMRRLYNREVGKVEDYFPMVTDFEAMSDLEIWERFGQPQEGGQPKKNIIAGATIERKKGAKQKVLLNALEIYNSHIDNVSYMLAMGETTKILTEVTKDERFGNAIGDYGKEILLRYLDLIARKGGINHDKTLPWLDKIRRNLGASVLGFKLSSILVQPSSFFDGAAAIGMEYAARGARELATSQEWRAFVTENMPEIRKRVGDDPAFMELSTNDRIKRYQELGLSPLQHLDAYTATSIAIGAYIKKMDEMGKEIDFEKPNKTALAYAQQRVRRTQGSSFYKDAPLALTQGALTGNRSVDKMFFTFQSFMLNRWSYISYDLPAELRNDKVKGAFAMTWLVMGTAFATGAGMLSKAVLAAIFGGEDEEDPFLKALAKDMVGTVPFVSQAWSSIEYGSFPVPAISTVESLSGGLSSLITGKKASTKAKGFVRFSSGVGNLLGVPGSTQAKDIIIRWLDE
jgi:hypothetical protein